MSLPEADLETHDENDLDLFGSDVGSDDVSEGGRTCTTNADTCAPEDGDGDRPEDLCCDGCDISCADFCPIEGAPTKVKWARWRKQSKGGKKQKVATGRWCGCCPRIITKVLKQHYKGHKQAKTAPLKAFKDAMDKKPALKMVLKEASKNYIKQRKSGVECSISGKSSIGSLTANMHAKLRANVVGRIW